MNGDSRIFGVAEARRSHDYLADGLDYHRRHLDRWLPTEGTVLDVGCGYGRVAAFYTTPARSVVALELESALLQALRGVVPVPSAACAAQLLPIKSGSAGAFVGLGIVELDPEPIMREARRVLCAGGLLYLSLPFRPRLRRASTSWNGFGIQSFTEEGARSLLTRHGFAPELIRRSSLAWGLGPFRPIANVFRTALLREDETALSYRVLAPVARPFANSLLVVGRG